MELERLIDKINVSLKVPKTEFAHLSITLDELRVQTSAQILLPQLRRGSRIWINAKPINLS